MDEERAKALVGERAAQHVRDGQALGLGTGSTVAHFLDALAARARDEGLSLLGVATSRRTEEHCRRLQIPLTTLSEHPSLDLCVDGADEVAPGLQLVKGLGGALFREKIVAAASDRFIVIVDARKEVPRLGTRSPIPIEAPAYAVPSLIRRLADLKPELRTKDGRPFVSDNGNHLLDLSTGPLADPFTLDRRLNDAPGVLEHGLFLDMADLCLVATEHGVRERSD